MSEDVTDIDEAASSRTVGVCEPDPATSGEFTASRRSPGRRHLLIAPLAAALSAACTREQVERFVELARQQQQPKPPAPPAPAPPMALSAEVAVDKLTFGPRPGLVDQVRAMGVAAWVDQQLSPSSLPDAESRLSGYVSLHNTNKQNFDLCNTDGGSDRIMAELDMATILRAVYSERQLYEVMCDFWSNHFNTWRGQTWMSFLKNRDHRDVVRAHALGKFSDMLIASAHSPAMLDYLDNLPNDASSPGGVNQNYARELLELHTLGIIDGQHVYTEDDVQNLALLMSGWSIQWSAGPNQYSFQFHPWAHTRSPVSLLGGTFTRPGRPNGQGYQDGVDFLGVLARHPSTARYICWKLVRRFVSDVPPMGLVDSAAAVFLANDTAIAPTLRHIIASPEFAASGRMKVRRPFEHLVACLRALNATVPNRAEGRAAQALRWALGTMGQPLFERETPDGYPDLESHWVSSAGLIERWSVAGQIARNGFGDRSDPADRVEVNLAALLPSPLPATVADLIGWMSVRLCNFVLPPADLAGLCDAISFAPSAAASTLVANSSRLALTVGLLLSHPRFQRR
jgi:uncharacterized protein (DUF1800 family)